MSPRHVARPNQMLFWKKHAIHKLLTLVVMRDRDYAQVFGGPQSVPGGDEELVLFQGYPREERVRPGHI